MRGQQKRDKGRGAKRQNIQKKEKEKSALLDNVT